MSPGWKANHREERQTSGYLKYSPKYLTVIETAIEWMVIKKKKQVIRGCHDGLKKREQAPVAGLSYVVICRFN